MKKILNKVEIEGSGCNTIKVIYEKSTSNIIVISEYDQEKKPRMPVINISVHYKFRTPRKGFGQKQKQKASIWKRRSKIMSVHSAMVLCAEKSLHPQTPKTCRENFTVQNQHSNIFPCMKNDHSTKENKKTILFTFYFLKL